MHLKRSTTATIAALGIGYVLGTAINDRPIRAVRRTAERTRRSVSTAATRVANASPMRVPAWARRNGHRVVDVRRVREAMSALGPTIGPKTTLRDAAAALDRAGAGEILVVKKRRPRGVVTRRALASAMGRGVDPAIAIVRDIASPVDTIGPNATVHEAIGRIRRSGADRMVVVDDEGAAIGVVSAGDASLADRVRSLVGRTAS